MKLFNIDNSEEFFDVVNECKDKVEFEPNRCAMTCQGCGAVFFF